MPHDLNRSYVEAFAAEIWQAQVDLIAYGMGAVVRSRVVRPGAMVETDILAWRMRRWKRPMFTLKDDDPQITWDDKAMAARPFRARKD